VGSISEITELLQGASAEAILQTLVVLELAALASVPSVLLRRRGRPTAAIAWLLSLFALPAVGSIAWWAIGRTRIERKLRRHHITKRDFVERHGSPSEAIDTRFDDLLPRRARGEYAFASSHNRVELLADGESAFPQMEAAIAEAERCVHMIFYIFKLDETGRRFCRLLKERALAGVKVRVLLDGFGCQKTAHAIRRELEPSGAEVRVFLPSRLWPVYAPRFNFVNHRKILAVDGRLAFTGGMNIGSDYEHSWRDLMVRVEGPAVSGLNHILLEDWYFATGDDLGDPSEGSEPILGANTEVGVVSSGPDTEGWIHDSYFMAITQARHRLTIATPYFIPTQAILTALRTAAGRGVAVSLIVPSLSDVRLVMWASRSFYKPLIEAGVRIFEYRSAMLHAKALVLDQEIASVGTANVDNRSFHLNFEVNCFIADKRIVSQLSDWMDSLMSESDEITSETLESTSTLRRLGESAAHLLSPLL
jgi:cardiolipin synthase